MSEDKIRIKTSPRYYSTEHVKYPAITFETLLAAITEVYAQAGQIGWETKALDDLAEWIRNAQTIAWKS